MLILQVQMLTAAISALLPLVPTPMRARVGELFDIVKHALAAGGEAAAIVEELRGVQAEIETMARAGRAVTSADFDAALARVRGASARFREAIRTAEQGA